MFSFANYNFIYMHALNLYPINNTLVQFNIM